MKKNIAAVVLCAGKGTRMSSETAKVLHPLLGRPLAAYPLARALEVGASPVVAIVGHQSEQVKATLEPLFPGRLSFGVQAEQRGTADAVRCSQAALDGFQGTVLILYGDTPLIRRETLQQLLAAHAQGQAQLTLATSEIADPTGYGRIARSGGKVVRIVEHKDATPEERAIREVNVGLYAVESAFLWLALKNVQATNAQRELYLTDLIALAAAEGEVASVSVPPEEMAGINDRAELAACARTLQNRINLAHLKAGVGMADPSSTFIEETVVLAPDVQLGPQVSLRGLTRLARGVHVDQGCVLTHARVEEDTEVKPYSILDDVQVAARCSVGPFARLRPGTVLEETAHVGNFVETKKTRLGRGSKANHLSYLGDADIGAQVNIGAGTITCNYDGVNKHATVIEDGAFIGSDSQLVAPVRVGRGALVAAGTTVTQDVPAESLVLTRPATVVKEGWVTRHPPAPNK